ncbi:MAG: hypothetical protein M9958_00395 [Chitinophagales bacterium]|nr:hypothetical protein [Chitinophagales bacterium]
MKTDIKQVKKKPYGYCKQIADIVGSDQYYVSKVLRNPATYNGAQAQIIKDTAHKIDTQKAEMRSAVQILQSQN